MIDDPRPDDALRSELRAEVGEPPYEAVDWERLRARVVSGAAAMLARRRVERPATWWEEAAGWGRAAIPLAIAAGIALAVVLVRGADGPAAARGLAGDRVEQLAVELPADALAPRAALEEAMLAPGGAGRMLPLILGAEHETWFLDATLAP
jgi:hypothetical protein